jgi:hypothetical protein
MKTILIAVKRPMPPTREEQMQGVERPDWQQWRDFVSGNDTRTAPTQGIERIGEGAWLIEKESGAPFLAEAIRNAESYHVPYILMFIEESTVWRQEPKRA